MHSVAKGSAAEQKAVDYLLANNFLIITRNWKTRRCEIDIVCYKNKTVYFVEVKYRSGFKQGTGLDYISTAKLKQMKFAADIWTAKNNWPGTTQLSALSINNSSDIEFIENIL